MNDGMRDVRVAEVARLARRWLGADALARRQESDAWWAALALRCARAALATDSGPGGAEQARADAITALTAALDLGLDAGTASLPALLEQHAPVAFSLPPAGSAVLRDPVDRVAPSDDGAWWTWSPLPADRDPVLTWPMPPVLLSRYRPLPGGTSAGDERDEALPAGRGLRLLVEYTRTGAPERLDEAVTLLERAVRTVASDSEAANGDLAWALLQRFTRSELRADLDGSVEHAMVAGVFDRDDEGGDARAPVWLAVLGLALLTRYELTGGPADLDNAVGALHRSVTALGEGHPDFDAVTSALADALLYRHGLTGASADLRLAGELVFTPEQPVAYAPSVYAAFLEDGDPTALNDAVGQARSALTRIRDDTRRPWALNGLAGFLLARYAALHDPSDAWAAVDRLQEARALLPPGTTPYATVLVNLAHALTAGPQRDTPAAARLAAEALDTPHISVRLEAQALELLCALAELSGHPDELALAPDLLDRRLTTLLEQRADAPADPRRTALRWAQARLRRSSGRPAEGLELARAVQEDRVWDVLAQPDAGESFRRARRALAEAAEMAVWMEEDGEPREAFAAIESARALTVLAATEADPVSARLTALGSGELQERWLLARTSAPTDRDPSRLPSARRGLGDAGPGADVPPELRAEVRGALLPSAGAGPQDFLGRPTPDALAEPLHAIGADAVVHVVAGRGHTPGLALVLHATGEVASLVLPHLSEQARELRRFARAHDECLRSPGDRAAGSAWRTALRQVCDWSWRAAVHAVHDHLSARAGAEAGRIPHVVFVPTGVLGLVPWHAARRKHEGARRYAIEDMCFSYAPSASALDGFARRQRSVPDGTGLVVADPLGDLPHARQEGADLHRWYYSKGSRLGRSGAADAMPATPRAVLEALLAEGDGPGPAVVHFACHARSCAPATESHLVLAGGQRLSVGSLLAHARPSAAHGRNPLVVLAACATAVPGEQYDEALSLATAFAAAGASCVIGTLWTVGDEHATRLMTDFHHFLNLDGLPAAQSLRQSQLRALDRARSRTAGSGPAARTRAEDPAHWAAFLHYGTGFPGPGGVRGGPDAEALSGSATDGLGPAAGTRAPLFSRMPGRERSEVIWICPQRDCLRRAAGDAKAPFDEDTCPDHPRQALRRE
ncbi:CHAT domain-containing protein [Streptomyces sp. NBC_00338]|uniref:CHAT domain-containing protein n=1 Tax=Streptomyces sp. NBC_00338 TaxID=2975715 RepID=UPI002256E7E5|nr:CHAT domain-containing protein [Streptomyces sp. NBC_00338]MCX5138961.1 CHAT domain-containing protein [Streptomyces sp. NBC_00338]